MLEKMDEFFEKRLSGYDEHMLTEIEGAREFYPFTASLLTKENGKSILDLGCGTGLELEFYFSLGGKADITCVDLSKGMLEALKKKFADKNIDTVLGSYFDVPFAENHFDSALSVESLHHFTKEEKILLYKKLRKALKADGFFVLTDYFASSADSEKQFRSELLRLKAEQGIKDDSFYHFDTPLTVGHEIEALVEAGFSSVKILKNWSATYTLVATK